jgi:hypothetical protein
MSENIIRHIQWNEPGYFKALADHEAQISKWQDEQVWGQIRRNLAETQKQREALLAPAPAPPVAPLPPPPAPMPATLAPEGITTFQSPPQTKAPPARAGYKLDESLLTSKKPSADLDKQQRIATSGETVPIVFGKRASGIGGVWLQPSMVKTGTKEFRGTFLYAISQGEIVSTPVKSTSWIGNRQIAYLSDSTVTMTHSYATAASLGSAPDVCPIGTDRIFCGIETLTYLSRDGKAEVGAQFVELYPAKAYWGFGDIILATGDVTNTVITVGGIGYQKVYRSDTGADVTSLWEATYGTSSFAPNSTGSSPPGRAAGDINSFFDPIDLIYDFPGSIGLDMPTGSYLIYIGEVVSVNEQSDPLLPASTGELYGMQFEYLWSPYADPSDTPTADNSAYADITFLNVTGQILERESALSPFALTPKQLSIFYEQGVKVDLYSGGLVGGVYPTGASNQLIDLVMYLFTIYKRAAGAATAAIAAPIYTGNMTDIAAFCDEYSLHYNGILDESVNLVEFASAIAPFFLLSFLSVGGQYRFQPILPLNNSDQIDVTALTPAETFDESNILPGSFGKAYKPVADRQDFIAVMLWRESDPSQVGIQRTVQVAYATTSRDAPVQQFDLTNFCCDPNHATIYGKYELARRKHSTHTISFQTSLVVTDLKPTDVIKLERQRISSKGDNRAEVDWYQITSISYVSDGTSEINAEHFPVDGSDIAVISDEVLNGSFRVLS